MSVLSTTLVRRIVGRHHTVTASELLADGLPRRDLDTWVATGVLAELHPGVYAVGDALRADPFHTRAAAACRRVDRVCDALTSARCWALPGVFAISRPTTIPIGEIPPGLVVERDDGIRVMSPAATWFGLAGVLRPDPYRAWSRTVLGERIGIVDAHDAVRSLADPRRAPHRRAVAALSACRRWQRPPGGQLERRVRASFRRRGIHGLDGAHTIPLADGVTVHPTVVDHRRRWGVEIDHVGWHGGRFPAGLRRWIDRRLAEAGWTIVTISDHRLEFDVAAAMRELVRAHEAANLIDAA